MMAGWECGAAGASGRSNPVCPRQPSRTTARRSSWSNSSASVAATTEARGRTNTRTISAARTATGKATTPTVRSSSSSSAGRNERRGYAERGAAAIDHRGLSRRRVLIRTTTLRRRACLRAQSPHARLAVRDQVAQVANDAVKRAAASPRIRQLSCWSCRSRSTPGPSFSRTCNHAARVFATEPALAAIGP